jgi:hypothetical protein
LANSFPVLEQPGRLRRFQFSLKALFVLVSLACAFLAYSQFMLSLIVLLLAVCLAGTLFVFMVFVPIKMLASRGSDKPEQ